MKRIIALLLLVPFCILINSCKKEDLGYDDKVVVLADDTGLENAFVVRERKRTYMGKDFEVLYIKNDTEYDYLLTVSGLFQGSGTSDSIDSVERTKPLFRQTEICFIFQSRTPFERFEYQISSHRKEYTNEGSFEYTSYVSVNYGPNPVDVNEGHEKVRVDVNFNLEFQSNFSDEKRINGTVIIFDNNGEIYWMCEDYVLYSIPGKQFKMVGFTIDDAFWDGNNTVPDNLKGDLEVAFDYEY